MDYLEEQLLEAIAPIVTVNMIVNQLKKGGGGHELPLNTLASLFSAVIPQKPIRWQTFMAGYLTKEWKDHALAFLTRKKIPRR